MRELQPVTGPPSVYNSRGNHSCVALLLGSSMRSRGINPAETWLDPSTENDSVFEPFHDTLQGSRPNIRLSLWLWWLSSLRGMASA